MGAIPTRLIKIAVIAGAIRAYFRKLVRSLTWPMIGCRIETPWKTRMNTPASAFINESRSIKKGSSGDEKPEYMSCTPCALETMNDFKVWGATLFRNFGLVKVNVFANISPFSMTQKDDYKCIRKLIQSFHDSYDFYKFI